MALVSVIIPVYKTEKYLSECLDSVVNQTLRDIEIICLNDASPDNSFEIIKSYADKDSRIIVVNFEQNKGVSCARNTAIDLAKGKYIAFIDSDDWVDKNYLKSMFDVIEETNSEIVINRKVYRFKNDNLKPYNYDKMSDIKDDSYIGIESDIQNVFYVPWSKLFKTDFIKKYNIKFPENYVYEDTFFHYTAFINAKKVYMFTGDAYYYRDREDSITSNINNDSDKIIKMFEFVYDYYAEHGFLKRNVKIYSTYPSFNISDEKTYSAFKEYFSKAGEYIMNNSIYNELDRFFCQNILNTSSFKDYISKFPKNVAISYIRRKNKVLL